MQVLHDRFADDPMVSLVAVHFNRSGDPAGYLREHGYTFRNIPDGGDIASAYGITMIPAQVIVGPDGRIVHRRTGRLTDEARDELEQLALQSRPPG